MRQISLLLLLTTLAACRLLVDGVLSSKQRLRQQRRFAHANHRFGPVDGDATLYIHGEPDRDADLHSQPVADHSHAHGATNSDTDT